MHKDLYLLHHLLPPLLMAILTSTSDHHQKKKKKHKHSPPPPSRRPPPKEPTSSWEQLKSLLSCRSIAPSQVHDPARATNNTNYTKLSSSCGSSICAIRDVVHGNTRVVHRSDTDRNSGSSSPGDSGRHETTPLARRPAPCSNSRGMQLRRLSGCYECQAVSVESATRRYPRLRTLCACPECGEVFPKQENLEMHQVARHAVSELGPEDSGRHIVEIIFKSSWHRLCDLPAVKIDRILKIHNTPRTIARFEDARAAVKSRFAHDPKKHPRCAADGNELLRFLPLSPLACALGAFGSCALCSSAACAACAVVRHGFPRGVGTMASSGRAHGVGGAGDSRAPRAMMVCRVIAGRVRRKGEEEGEEEEVGFDSVVGGEDGGTDLEELFVGNPRAILPCFVVIYRIAD